MSIATKGFRYARTGPIASVLKLEQYNATALNPDKDVIVQISHAPIHRVDAAVINGTALGRLSKTQSSPTPTVRPQPFPRVGGFEGLGIVADAGRSTRVKKGDAVWISPTAATGTWATHVSADADHVHVLPKGLSAQQLLLAACATNLIAAQRVTSRHYTRLTKDDVVIVNGGSSLTSLAITANAVAAGATVIVAATPGARFATAEANSKKAGAVAVVEYNSKGAKAARDAAKGKRIALFANGVGGRYFNDFARLLGHEGVSVTFGAQNGFGLSWAGSNQIFNNTTHVGLFVPRYLAGLSYAERQAVFEAAVKASASLPYPTSIVKKLEDLPAEWDASYLNGGKKPILVLQ